MQNAIWNAYIFEMVCKGEENFGGLRLGLEPLSVTTLRRVTIILEKHFCVFLHHIY